MAGKALLFACPDGGQEDELLLLPGEVVARQELGLVAWPRRFGRRYKLQLAIEVDNNNTEGREQLDGWLGQLVGATDCRQLLVFVNPHSGTGRAKTIWQKAMKVAGLSEEQVSTCHLTLCVVECPGEGGVHGVRRAGQADAVQHATGLLQGCGR